MHVVQYTASRTKLNNASQEIDFVESRSRFTVNFTWVINTLFTQLLLAVSGLVIKQLLVTPRIYGLCFMLSNI